MLFSFLGTSCSRCVQDTDQNRGHESPKQKPANLVAHGRNDSDTSHALPRRTTHGCCECSRTMTRTKRKSSRFTLRCATADPYIAVATMHIDTIAQSPIFRRTRARILCRSPSHSAGIARAVGRDRRHRIRPPSLEEQGRFSYVRQRLC